MPPPLPATSGYTCAVELTADEALFDPSADRSTLRRWRWFDLARSRARMVDQLVACKHGRQPIKKMHPLIDDILKPTYDVIVYLDQVMQIAQKLANYSLGGADLLRRAMGNKKKEEMDQQTDIFLKDAVQNNVDPAKAKEIFDLVAQFAKYGFNRSHSAGYASVTYQSAYLKAHFTAEFLCALMTADREKTEKVVRIIDEGRAMGVEILAPNINGSDTDFKVVYEALAGDWSAPRGARLKDRYQPKIRFGLGAVRGVGDAALEFVFEARRDGPFKDLFDFRSRVDARKLNRGVLEALVHCGAFDATLRDGSVTRAQAFAAIDLALDRGRSARRGLGSNPALVVGLELLGQGLGAMADGFLDGFACRQGVGRGERTVGDRHKCLFLDSGEALGCVVGWRCATGSVPGWRKIGRGWAVGLEAAGVVRGVAG
jgi:DNA polymerase III alpha subunit